MSIPSDQSSLPKNVLGKTGLEVTPLCFGYAALGNMPDTFAYEVADEQAFETLRAAFASPVNFSDTAASYGDGESERRIGLVLKEIGGIPAGHVLASKADRHLQTGDFSGDQIKRSVERSLKLLGIDKIQIMHLHDPEHAPFTAIMAPGGPVDVLLDLKRQGVIGHVGVAGGPVDLMIRYVETGAFDLLITHNRYTLLNRSADALLTLASEKGMGVINAAPYGSGILAKGPDAYPRYAYQEAPDVLVERTRQLDAICKEFGVPLAAAALQFSTHDPRMHSTVVGITRANRIQQTIDLYNHPIPAELWTRLAEVPFETDDPEANRWS
jgi:D-threo-aldose 1-dehydrogenase